MIRVNGNPVEWHEGMTVQKVLDVMKYDFALLTVSVNNKYIPTEDYDTEIVPDGADMQAIHLHHGG